MTTLKARMTQGSVMSWLAGILLGLVLGVALLIVTNAGTPSAKDPVKDGVAVTTDASTNEAAQKGNTPETAGVSQGSQGGVSDSSTNGSQTTAATVGDPATTASDEGEQQAAPSSASEGAGTSGDASGASTDASGAAAEGQSGAEAGGAAAQGDAAAGQTLFAGTCGGCHGAQGQGALGPAMNKEANTWDLAGFTTVLREGKTPDGRQLAPTMPRFAEGQLSDQDIANIHAWVQGL